MKAGTGRGFTLVEILVVVVTLGILAAIVVPQFSNATSEARATGTFDQLTKIRRVVDVYYVRHGNSLPNVVAGDGTWGELLTEGYLREPPVNLWVGGDVPGRTIILGAAPDPGYQTTHGWIYDPATGQIWAGAFDGNDQPYPLP